LGASPATIDPEAYLADVNDRMAKGHPVHRLDELLPCLVAGQAGVS
jgi:IS66 C-terminal element